MIINKDITRIIIKYLSIKDKILISKINKALYKYIKNILGKLYYLIDDINKMRHGQALGDIIYPYNNDSYKLFEKYNDGKIIRIDYTFWSSLEKKINKLKYDDEVEGIYIDTLDRGVGDWKVLDNILRKKFPKYKNIYTDQMFGADNLSESKCELIFLFTNSNIEVDLSNLIYKKILYHPNYEDWNDDDPEYKIYINLLKVNNQIQVIMGEDVENL
jgi:hypothetical protein